MSTFVFVTANLLLIAVFIYSFRIKNLLSYTKAGRWLLTWLAIGVITLMDELTSNYYAPIEAYRFIGEKAVIYIAVTSLLVRLLSTRMVEIAEILEYSGMRGGGVYSFSYLVFGEGLSFISLSSILITYILTATISTVSAVENTVAFLELSSITKFLLMLGVVWGITYLNILGIKENSRFTYAIFIFAAFVIINMLIAAGFSFDAASFGKLESSYNAFTLDFTGNNIPGIFWALIAGIGSSILAYSGIESVLQTASLVDNWKVIRKAYLFLALSVGIVTPLIAMFVLTSPHIDLSTPSALAQREGDLVPYFARLVGGGWFGIVMSLLAGFTLMMAVNTAMVASAELIDKVADRYSFGWLTAQNKQQSLYRIHLINGAFYTIILVVTMGSQATLAEMYAVGLVASFCINIGALLKYRYSKGTTEIPKYYTSRTVTLILFVVLLGIFTYIVLNRPYGTGLWLIFTSIIMFFGYRITKHRSPETHARRETNHPMDVIFAIAEQDKEDVHLYFRRPRESDEKNPQSQNIYVTFYSPRIEKREPVKLSYHFWIAQQPRMAVYQMISGVLDIIKYEIGKAKQIHVHLGWPASSWFDRISTGFMMFNLLKLPKKFPDFLFHLDYIPSEYKEIVKRIENPVSDDNQPKT